MSMGDILAAHKKNLFGVTFETTSVHIKTFFHNFIHCHCCASLSSISLCVIILGIFIAFKTFFARHTFESRTAEKYLRRKVQFLCSALDLWTGTNLNFHFRVNRCKRRSDVCCNINNNNSTIYNNNNNNIYNSRSSRSSLPHLVCKSSKLEHNSLGLSNLKVFKICNQAEEQKQFRRFC